MPWGKDRQSERLTKPTLPFPTWEEAMTLAAERLARVEENFPPGKDAKTTNGWTESSTWNSHLSVAQCWIAYARELTMHSRAER